MRRSGQPQRSFCSAGDCLDDAVTHGQVTFEVGAVDDEWQTFSLPLCQHHAHLLGLDNTLVNFRVGLLEDAGGR